MEDPLTLGMKSLSLLSQKDVFSGENLDEKQLLFLSSFASRLSREIHTQTHPSSFSQAFSPATIRSKEALKVYGCYPLLESWRESNCTDEGKKAKVFSLLRRISIVHNVGARESGRPLTAKGGRKILNGSLGSEHRERGKGVHGS